MPFKNTRADPTIQDINGNTPLHLGFLIQHLTFVANDLSKLEYLLTSRLDLNKKNCRGSSLFLLKEQEKQH